MSLRIYGLHMLRPALRTSTAQRTTFNRSKAVPVLARRYATPSDAGPDSRAAGSLGQKIPPELAEKFLQAPRTLAQIKVVAKMLEEKGIPLAKPPGVMQMMKIARDTEVMQAMKTLKETMDEEDVTTDVMEIIKAHGSAGS